jgi:ketosteroid isomerase-like protein
MLILALLFSSMSFATATAASGRRPDVDEAWAHKAITANDLNAVIAVYAEDAVMCFPTPLKQRPGRPSANLTRPAAANTVTGATLANTHYQTFENFSVGWGNFTLTLSPKAGGQFCYPIWSLLGNREEEGGTWVYVVDHASADPLLRRTLTQLAQVPNRRST